MFKDRMRGFPIYSGIWCDQATRQVWMVVTTCHFNCCWENLNTCSQFEMLRMFGNCRTHAQELSRYQNHCLCPEINASHNNTKLKLSDGRDKESRCFISEYTHESLREWMAGPQQESTFADFNSKCPCQCLSNTLDRECSNYQ